MTQQELKDFLESRQLIGKQISVATSNRKYSGTAVAVENGVLHIEGDPLYRTVRITISHIEAIF